MAALFPWQAPVRVVCVTAGEGASCGPLRLPETPLSALFLFSSQSRSLGTVVMQVTTHQTQIVKTWGHWRLGFRINRNYNDSLGS